MKNNYYARILNWVLPIVVVVIILTGGLIEGLVIMTAYIVYRFYNERDKYFSFFGKNNYLKGKLNKAVKNYEKAYKTGKAEAKVIVSYAYALVLCGEFHRAEEILAELSARQDADEVYTQRSLCEAVIMWKRDMKLSNAIASVEHFDETIRTSSYYSILGKMYLDAGDMRKAREFNEDAYRYNGRNPGIIENLVRLYCEIGEYDRAAKAGRVLLKNKPQSLDACWYCGVAFEETGDLKKAAKLYRKALGFEESIVSTVGHDDVVEKIGDMNV